MVVAAGSVVRGRIPDHAVIGGVPARVLREHRPGIGWVRPDGGPDITPERPTIPIAELAERLALLGDAEEPSAP